MVDHADIVSRLGEAKVVLAASSARVLLARVKGYPHWPAQILSDAVAAKKLGKKRRDNDVPVMFFGTNEIALIGKDDCFSWSDGVQKGLLSKGKQKGFIKAIEQVYEFLHLDKKRKAPPHWWCKPPSLLDDAKGQANLEENEEDHQEEVLDESGPSGSSSEEDDEEDEEEEVEGEEEQNGGKKHPGKPKDKPSKLSETSRPGSGRPPVKPKDPAPSNHGNDPSFNHRSPNTAVPSKATASAKPSSQPALPFDPDSKPPLHPNPYSHPHPSNEGGFRVRRTRQAGPEQSSASLAEAPIASSGSAREGSVTLVAKEEVEGGGVDEGLAAFLDEDISKLPAEIRRLAGIKISKRPGTNAKPKVQHNSTDDEQGLGPSTSMPPPPRKAPGGPGKKVSSQFPPRPKASEANAEEEGGGKKVGRGKGKVDAIKSDPEGEGGEQDDPGAPSAFLTADNDASNDVRKLKVETQATDPGLSAWGDLVGMTTGRRVLRDRREGLSSPTNNGVKPSPSGNLASPSGRNAKKDGAGSRQHSLTIAASLDGPMPVKVESKDQLVARKREREKEKEKKDLTEKKKTRKENAAAAIAAAEEEDELEASAGGEEEEIEAGDLPSAFATGLGSRGGRRKPAKIQLAAEEDEGEAGDENVEMGTESEEPPLEESEDSGMHFRPRAKRRGGRGGLRVSRQHDEDPALISPSSSIQPIRPIAIPMVAPDAPIERVPSCIVAPELAPPPPPLLSRRSTIISASSPTAAGSAGGGGGGGGELGAMTLANGLTVQGSVSMPTARLQSQNSNGPRVSRALQQLGHKSGTIPQPLVSALPAQRKIKPTAKFMQGRGLGRRATYSSSEEEGEGLPIEPPAKRGGSGSGLNGGGRGGHPRRNAVKKDLPSFVTYADDEDLPELELRNGPVDRGELVDAVVYGVGEELDGEEEEEEEEEDLLDAEAAEALQLMGMIAMAPARPPSAPLPAIKEPVILSSGSVLIPAGGTAPLTDGILEPMMVAPAPGLPPHEHKLDSFTWPKGDPLLPFTASSTGASDYDFDPFMPPGEWLMIPHPQYEPIKRNAWINAKRPGRLHREEISICSCSPPQQEYDETGTPLPLLGCSGPNNDDMMAPIPGCRNRQAMIHCDPKTCPCGELCSNKPFHLLGPGPVIQAFLTENRGHGVKAMQAINKGSFVIEYLGEVVDARELSQRMAEARRAGERHSYAVELAPGLFVDARKKGNVSRLINSSCDPNCEVQRWHDAATGEIRAGIFAKKDIAPGQELTHDFFFFFAAPKGSSSHQLAQEMNAFQCLCGAKSCRNSPSLSHAARQGVHLKDRGRRCEVEWEGDGVMYRATVMGYNSTTRRHNLLYDDGDREKINLEEVAHRWLDARGMPEGISHPLTSHGPMAMDVGGSLLGQGLAVGGPGKRGGLGAVPSHYQPGAKGGAHVKNKGGYAVGGELDSMASLLQAVQVVQGPSDDLSLDFEPQVGGWAQQQQQQQQQVMTMKSPGRKGKQQNQGQFNSFLGHSQLPPGPSSGPSRRLKLDEALGFSLPPCPIPMFRTLPPPSSATGRAACTSPKLFGSSPPPAVSGASVSSSAALYRLQNHREEVGTLLFDQDSGLSQLIKDASSNQVPPQRKDVPHVNGMLGKVLNSQLLAAMPASSMNTVQLYRAYKFG